MNVLIIDDDAESAPQTAHPLVWESTTYLDANQVVMETRRRIYQIFYPRNNYRTLLCEKKVSPRFRILYVRAKKKKHFHLNPIALDWASTCLGVYT